MSATTELYTRVEFKSAAFPKYANEDNEIVNPNRWGKRLAEFIRDNLPSYGIPTEDILCEDWGWLISVSHDPFPLWIGCGPLDDLSDSLEGTDLPPEQPMDAPVVTEFCIFVKAEPGFFRKLFKKIDINPAVSKVVSALMTMIEERDEFSDAVWEK